MKVDVPLIKNNSNTPKPVITSQPENKTLSQDGKQLPVQITESMQPLVEKQQKSEAIEENRNPASRVPDENNDETRRLYVNCFSWFTDCFNACFQTYGQGNLPECQCNDMCCSITDCFQDGCCDVCQVSGDCCSLDCCAECLHCFSLFTQCITGH